MRAISTSTIVAISTGSAQSAIGIVRISGSKSKAILEAIFVPYAKSKNINPRELHLGWIVDGDIKIDQAMAVYMPAPRSYTGEDMVEIQAHGSPRILQYILRLATKNSAELATPGEFALRAFLNEKIDLTQAEATAELIASNNIISAKIASTQLAGALAKLVRGYKQEILSISAHLVAHLDFSEEDIVEIPTTLTIQKLKKIEQNIVHHLKNTSTQASIRNGISVALVGLPNAGKSSLLNTLLGFERAIVTNVAGTTRDTLSESVQIKDLSFVLTDTAGLRSSSDKVEKIGIERTYSSIQNSDIVLVLSEVEQEKATLEYLEKSGIAELIKPKRHFWVYTKSDIATKPDSLAVSIKNPKQIQDLQNVLYKSAQKIELHNTEFLLSGRQIQLLEQAREELNIIVTLLKNHTTLDIVLVEIQALISTFNSITGEDTTQEMLDEVFSNFCIGK